MLELAAFKVADLTAFDHLGAEDFQTKLDTYGGPDARAQWARLLGRIQPLGDAIFALPSAAVRADAGVLLTMGRFAPALGRVLLAGGSSLQQPFSRIPMSNSRPTKDRPRRKWRRAPAPEGASG